MTKAQQVVLAATSRHVHDVMFGEGSGHDWWHVVRVRSLALTIAEQEGGDRFIVELAALLHDIADWKFHDGDISAGPRAARKWLEDQKVAVTVVEAVAYIVEHISYRGGTNAHVMQSLEGKIVQDADRLDAVGAIGIGRTFAFGGAHGRQMYDPSIKPKAYEDFAAFRAALDGNTTINHFYEKLLLLKDKMNTATGTAIAQRRHQFMETFLEEFYAEWEGVR